MADLFDDVAGSSPQNKGKGKTEAAPKKPTARKKAASGAPKGGYSAKDIEVLEGLEPVRKRPGMYIGGTDERALHHLAAEVLDNSMDEAVAGHASRIEITLDRDDVLTIKDNGRGIPIDQHPKYKKPALEVILTTLHSGGKFSNNAYETSGGLHGVGVSVVNALSDELTVEVFREQTHWHQTYSRGAATSKLKKVGEAKNKRGTSVTFHPDPEIFGKKLGFKPERLWRMARSKAYLHRGVEIRWRCDPSLVEGSDTPAEATFHFPGGLTDFLSATIQGRTKVVEPLFADQHDFGPGKGKLEWAVAWIGVGDVFTNSYCNTVPTPEGGTHEAGLRSALTKGLKAYGELVGNKRAGQITADDVMGVGASMLSIFIPNPEFVGQTKDRLSTVAAQKLTEQAIRDHFDHWLSQSPKDATKLLEWVIDRAEERQRRKAEKDVSRKAATRKLRLPGKLADCSQSDRSGTEIFLVEGDSAGGSAKQARNRKTQAILPLRGKILNVASATRDKIRQNQEIQDICQALGVGLGVPYSAETVRYEKVIIMTDADVDGAHIAALLMTFFLKEMPGLIEDGRLYLSTPPLYRISQGGKVAYARDEAHREELLASEFTGRGKIDIGRFKGLGEMLPKQLRETTMDPALRTLLRVNLTQEAELDAPPQMVERLMGRKAEERFKFIQENAAFVEDLDI
ncbi:MAG: DNA topoisomerase IV subunit B [Alphaproteobacteria bacterium]